MQRTYPPQNNGVILGAGSSITADQFVTGEGASATKTVYMAAEGGASAPLEALREQLARLTALIEQHGQLVDPSAREAIGLVVSEAAKPKPNKLVLASIIDGTATALKSVASLGSAALAIKALIAAL